MLASYPRERDSEKSEVPADAREALPDLATSMLRSPGPDKRAERRPRAQGSTGRAEAVPQPDRERDRFRFMDPTPAHKARYDPGSRARAECPDAGSAQRAKIGPAERRKRALAYTEQLQRWQREKLRGLGRPARRGLAGDV